MMREVKECSLQSIFAKIQVRINWELETWLFQLYYILIECIVPIQRQLVLVKKELKR